MAHLEDLKRDTIVKGILLDQQVTVIDAKWIGSAAIKLTYKDERGNLGDTLVYRDDRTRSRNRHRRPLCGVLTGTEHCFALSPKPTVFDWHICSIHDWRFIHQVLTHCHTRSQQFTKRCSHVNPCVICLPMIPARERRL